MIERCPVCSHEVDPRDPVCPTCGFKLLGATQAFKPLAMEAECTIFLNDMTVSRMHATIEPEDGCYVIRDANSFNGVWVNNENVEARTLRPGDFIQIGTFCLQYEEN